MPPALGATPPELDLAKLASAQFNSPLGGWVAQSVEQRTENPCVAGSIPAPATILKRLEQGVCSIKKRCGNERRSDEHHLPVLRFRALQFVASV
jgi:hypothetical protein